MAAWRMMKRGCRVVFVHFHSTPYLPATCVSPEEARALEARLNLAQLVKAGLDGAQEETFAFPPGTGPYPQLRSASSLPRGSPNI